MGKLAILVQVWQFLGVVFTSPELVNHLLEVGTERGLAVGTHGSQVGRKWKRNVGGAPMNPLSRLRYHQCNWPAIRHEAKAMLRLLGCVLFVGFVWALTVWLFMAGRMG